MEDKILVLSNGDKGLHSHSDVEIIYSVIGILEVNLKGTIYRVPPNNVYVVNSSDVHQIRSTKNSLYLKINIPYFEMIKSTGKNRLYFYCNSSEDNSEKDYGQLIYCLEMILKEYASTENDLKLKSLYYYLWSIMCQQFLEEEKTGANDTRINQILDYINKHYREHISLKDISEKFYISQSAFSKFFKGQMNIGFKEYINELRIYESKRMLSESNTTITEIALDTGFKTVTLFNKNFKDYTGMTPSEYRNKMSVKADDDRENAMKLLAKYRDSGDADIQDTVYKISLDNLQHSEQNKIYGLCGGFLNDLKDGTVQSQLRAMVEKIPIEYVNIYNALDDAFEDVDSIQKGEFDFDGVDQIIDFLLELRLKPYFELPGRSRIIMSHIGGEKIEYKDPRFRTNSVDHWKRILTAFATHIAERYSLRIVSDWKFEFRLPAQEVINPDRFLELYEVSYRIIREYLPGTQIGGINVNSEVFRVESDEIKSLTNIFQDWKTKNLVPDFITIMSYPYGVTVAGDDSYRLDSIRSSEHFIEKDILEYRAILDKLGMEDIPIVVSEWNTSLSQRNPYNDSCGKACHMLRQMVDMALLGVSHFYNGITDKVYQYYDAKGPLIGASALITKDGIHKPAYYSYELWSKLGNNILGNGENFIATSQNDGSIQILAFNGKDFSQSYLMNEESLGNVQEISTMFYDENVLSLSFEISDLNKKDVGIRTFRIKENEGSVLAEFKTLGKQGQLIKEEIDYLTKMCTPRLTVNREPVISGSLDLKISLEPNEIALVLIQ